MSEEKMQTSPFECPAWFDGKKINETVFCEEFLRDYPMVTVNNAFFTVNGRVHDENRLKKVIYDRIKYYVTSGVAKKVTNLLDVMRMECCTAKLSLYQDRIHVANGTYYLNGTFSSEKDFCRNRLPVAYHPDAPQPVTWLHFLSQLLEPEDILTLQEFMGYCFIPSTKGQNSVLQDDFFNFMRNAGYTDVERGEHGSTEEHLTVTQFKVQAEQQRLEAVTEQVVQAEQSLEDAKAATEKQKKKLEALQKETKAAKAVALTAQEIESMGKKNSFTGNITLTADECRTLKDYAVSSFAEKAEKIKYKQKYEQAEKSAKVWKQRFEKLQEQYLELKQKVQPFLDAIEVASERVWAFVNTVLARGKETQEHKAPARKRGQDMEI